MKKLLLAIGTIILTINANAQFNCSCLPDGITFTSQAQIDSFPINYPGCTEIEGDVLINGYQSNNITNLNGLNVLTSLGGHLSIHYTSLIDLSGLDNVVSIDSSVYIVLNHSLVDLSGLNGLESVGKDFNLGNIYGGNNSLVSLNGLGNLEFIGGSMSVRYNSLVDLTGVESLSSIGGDLVIAEDSLTSLDGLQNLTTINGSLSLGSREDSWVGPYYYGNPLLEDLLGLDNLQNIGGDLLLYRNDKLTDLRGLDNLLSIGGGIIVGGHAGDGPQGWNEALINFNGLENISVVGSMSFYRNPSLQNFQGLNNLDTITGDFTFIAGESQTNFAGLDNLVSVNGNVVIGTEHYNWPDNGLQNFTGLENLENISQDLIILNNDSLQSLYGLDNLSNIGGNLTITGNPDLFSCEVQALCDYIANPNGTIEIHDNTTGCDSQEEVEEACLSVYIDDEFLSEDEVSVYPNPVFDHVNIKGIQEDAVIRIFNMNGTLLYQHTYKNIGPEEEVHLNLGSYPAGMYFIQLGTGSELISKKIIKN